MATRRDFMKSLASAAAMAGVAGAPQFSFAQDGTGRTKTFIKIFQRGGADGLHLFPMYDDPFYQLYRSYAFRNDVADESKDLAIRPPMGSDGGRALFLGSAALDNRPATSARGMNPNLQSLMTIWNTGNMMVAPSTSFAGSNRSHFDCQRWIGTGITRDNLADGYLNRYLVSQAKTDHPLRGVVAGKTSISTEIRGASPVPAIVNSGSYRVDNNDLCGVGCNDFLLTDIMRDIASHEVDLSAAEGNIKDNQLLLLDSLQDVTNAAAAYTPGATGLTYSNTDLGRGLQLCAQLIKNGLPLEVAAMDWNIGWDTHSNQIGDDDTVNPITDQNKRYNQRMKQGADDLLTFWLDMGGELGMRDVVVLVGSEFGRTKKQNGSIGTDHGQGGGWFAFGGPTLNRVAPDVSTLDDAIIGGANYVPTTTSYRDIVGEIMVKHMLMPENMVTTVFPGHTFNDFELFRTPTSS